MAARSQIVPLGLAGLVACCLVAVFVAPFYGALDRPVEIIAGDNRIVTEDFDYPEPDINQNDTGTPSGAADSSAVDELNQGNETFSAARPTENALTTQPDVAADGPLQRIAPRPPLSDMGLVLPQASAPVPSPDSVAVDPDGQMQLLHRPVALAAGRFESNGRLIDLQGIDIVPVEEMCGPSNGESWPCGMQARTAFRSWLRARAIMCRLPADDMTSAVITSCTLGGEDVALWLVRNGWARVGGNAESAYAEAAKQAADSHLGIYGTKPDTSLPDLLAPLEMQDMSSEETTNPAPAEPPAGYFPPPPVERAPLAPTQ